MNHLKYLLRAALLAILTANLLPSAGYAQAITPPVPDGFYLISSAPGVSLYRKDYSGGSPDFVQVVELNAGARIVNLHGEIGEQRPGKGSYGGNDARIMSQSLEAFWRQLSAEHTNAFCVLNGQFFFMQESPTRLPFPLKVGDEIVSDGYGLNEFPDNKLILEIWPDRVNLNKLTHESLYSSSAPDIIGGLTQTANKRSDRYVGRTFVGVDDRDQDGTSETFLVFNSSISRQVDAAGVLHSFGADQVMMLDGGGSTQLICNGEGLIKSDRPIPQAIGILPAPAEYLPASQPDPAQGEPAQDAEPLLIIPTEEAASVPSGAEIQGAPATESLFELSDALWVPLIMSPVLAVLVFFVNRFRFQ